MPRTILLNGKFATLDPAKPRATAVAIKDGVFEAVGRDDETMRLADGRIASEERNEQRREASELAW